LEARAAREQRVRPGRLERRVAAEVLRMEERVRADLVRRVAADPLRDAERSDGVLVVAGPEPREREVELDDGVARERARESLHRVEAVVRPRAEGDADLRRGARGLVDHERRLSGPRARLLRVLARRERHADDGARRGDRGGGDHGEDAGPGRHPR
jgi:hypothetical protein